MKTRSLFILVMILFSVNAWGQKKEYKLRDLTGMIYLELNRGTSPENLDKWLVKTFQAKQGESEDPSYVCYNLSLVKGVSTRVLLMKGRVGVESTGDGGLILDEMEAGLKELNNARVLLQRSSGVLYLIGVDHTWKVDASYDPFQGSHRLLIAEME